MSTISPLDSTSKFLSLVLRHAPEKIGLALDAQGWAGVAELLACSASHGKPLTRALLDEVVATSDKKRFAFSADGLSIRASQGHSLAAVDLALQPAEPPELLYHGTATRFAAAILAAGLLPGARNHVHWSALRATAVAVGKRHGEPLVLELRARALHALGQTFYKSDNGVWLTGPVAAAYLAFPAGC